MYGENTKTIAIPIYKVLPYLVIYTQMQVLSGTHIHITEKKVFPYNNHGSYTSIARFEGRRDALVLASRSPISRLLAHAAACLHPLETTWVTFCACACFT